MTTFFTEAVNFQEVPEQNEILVASFLQAARTIPKLFDMLGKAFIAVKSDVEGNINKLQKYYDSNPERYQTFQSMLQDDIDKKETKKKDSAVVALLWLKRGLQYMINFMNALVEDHRSGKKTENMSEMNKKAYEDSLKEYHGWVVRKVFSVVSHAMPWRKDFIKTLALGKEDMDDQIIEEMAAFTGPMERNVVALNTIYKELELDTTDKV